MASLMPIKIIRNQENNLFVFAQMKATRCIGEQDQKKYLNIQQDKINFAFAHPATSCLL